MTTRAVFGVTPPPPPRYAGDGRLGSLPLVEACPDPTATRTRQRLADAGLGQLRGNVSPCYRCLAYRPDTVTGCHFTERTDKP